MRDRRSGRGLKEREQTEEQVREQEHQMMELNRRVMLGPAVQLTFENEHLWTMWRNGIEIEGRRALADRVQGILHAKTADEYNALIVDLGVPLGGPEVNMVGAQNVLRRFLGLPVGGE